MRVMLLGSVLALAGCVVTAEIPSAPAPTAFPQQRGTALPPPAPASAQAAPPEGVGPGGIDFGAWRQADPARYAPQFQTQLRQRHATMTPQAIRADLERNGFACTEVSGGLDCRIEIMERQCAFDWYYVLPAGRAEPTAGYEIMCLGAR